MTAPESLERTRGTPNPKSPDPRAKPQGTLNPQTKFPDIRAKSRGTPNPQTLNLFPTPGRSLEALRGTQTPAAAAAADGRVDLPCGHEKASDAGSIEGSLFKVKGLGFRASGFKGA